MSAKDFRVAVDGIEQKIDRIVPEGWDEPIRDNKTWHEDYSITPAGIWGTVDLDAYCQNHPRVCSQPDLPGSFDSLAYAPAASDSGCHKITVKVDIPNTEVFAGDQYCAGQTPTDPLYGTSIGNELVQDLDADKPGKIPLSVQTGFLYAGKKGMRVDVRLAFPWDHLNHQWDNSTSALRAGIGVLGEVYGKDRNTPLTRFSDLLYPPYWPTFLFGWAGYIRAHDLHFGFPPDPVAEQSYLREKDPCFLPSRYETQVMLSTGGQYDLRIILSDGKHFGRADVHLDIPEYEGKQLALSSVLLCKRYRDAHAAAVERKTENFAPQYVPLVSKGVEFTPAGDTTFEKGEDPLIAYFEVYEPGLAAQPKLQIQAHVRIVDAATGQLVKDFPPVDAASYIQPGTTAIHIARNVPFERLPKGNYRLEVLATDSAGDTTPWRGTNFTIENKKSR